MKVNEISQQVSSTLGTGNVRKKETKELEFQKLLEDANVKLNDASQRISPSPHDGRVQELTHPALSTSAASGLLKC